MQKSLLQLFLITCFSFSTLATYAQTTRYVDGINGNDDGGNNNCSNSGNPCATITHALNVSNPGDIVTIAPAEYTEVLHIDKSISLKGTDQTNTIIQAHSEPYQAVSRVITLSEYIEVNISDVTIRHGNATVGGGYPYKSGGGIYVQNASLTLSRVLFYKNKADSQGGGLSTRYSEVELNSVSFVENESYHDGGAIVNYNTISQKLTNVSFINNNSINNSGGAIFNTSESNIEMVNVLFYGNTAPISGGINITASSNIIVTNGVFYGNIASGQNSGGAVDLFFDTNATFTNTIFWGNSGPVGNDIRVSQTASAELYYSLYDNTDPNSIVVLGNGQFLCENCIHDDPQFVDAQNLNFSLQENSVAIDTGDPSIDLSIFPVNEQNIPIDLANNPRVIGNSIDIGPYEFQGTASINDFNDSYSDVKLYPNPVNDLLYINSKNGVEAVTIYDITGRKVKVFDTIKYSNKNLGKNLVIDLTGLSKNIYILKIKTIAQTGTYKIIKR